jgi:hypothetical protein
MWVFMLKSCDFAGIWWQMCAGIENACVFCNEFVILCWYLMIYVLELKMHVCSAANLWFTTEIELFVAN